MQNDLLANIIAGTIQIIPLIAVPFILKGVLDGVPVLGQALQKGFNKTFSAADKGQKAIGLGAVRRAQILNGERNMFGARNRSGKSTLIENFGNRRTARNSRVKGIETERGERFKAAIADADPEKRVGLRNTEDTVSVFNRAGIAAQQGRIAHDQTENAEHLGKETSQRLTNAFDAERADLSTNIGQRERNIQRLGQTNKETNQRLTTSFDAERLDENTSTGQSVLRTRNLADQSTTLEKSADSNWEEGRASTSAPISGSLRAAGINQNSLIQRASMQQGLEQSTALAKGIQRTNYGSALDSSSPGFDPTILDVSGGQIDPNGQLRAQAYGVQAVREAQSKNIQANMLLVNDQVRRASADAAAQGLKGREYTDLGLLEKQFNEAVEAKDLDRMRAVATLTLRQGSSGYDSIGNSILKPENQEVLRDNVELSRDFRGYMVDEHAKDLKVRHRDVLQFMFTGKPVNPAQVGEFTIDKTTGVITKNATFDTELTEQARAFYGGLTPEESASQTESSIYTGVQSGGLDLTTAQSVLLEDGLVQKMTTKQITAMVYAVKLASQDSDPKRRQAARQTAENIISNDNTFKRFDKTVKDILNDLSGKPRDPSDLGGEPGPGPASSGDPTATDEGPLTDDGLGGIGGDD